jgi:arginyl-tRNA synthetase
VQRKSEQHMDFDLDLARSQSNENPVYYVQYAHARICSVFAKAKERGIELPDYSEIEEAQLDSGHEEVLLNLIGRFPEMIGSAASHYEPHQVSYYLRELATAFHAYYNACKFLDAPDKVRDARLGLLQATRQVLRNGLAILGVSAPEKM